MIWVGNFKSLQSALDKPRSDAPREVHTWLRSEIDLISPFADWLMSLIARSGCIRGKEEFVELALREAVSNAMLHGNRMDARKLVHIRCCCEGTKGVFIVVRDQGRGFDPNNVPDPLAVRLMQGVVSRKEGYNEPLPNVLFEIQGPSTAIGWSSCLTMCSVGDFVKSWAFPVYPRGVGFRIDKPGW